MKQSRPDSAFTRQERVSLSWFRPLTLSSLFQGLVCLVALGLNLWLLSAVPFQRMENAVLDQFFRQRPPLPTDPRIVLIEISEDGLQEIGRWPWPRHYHAVLTSLLKQWGAKAVLFDVLFSEPSDSFDDDAFSQALQQASCVYLPVVLEKQESRGEAWIHSIPALERWAIGTGHINVLPDRDGGLRRIPPVLLSGGEEHLYMSLRVAYDILGEKPPALAAGRAPFPTDSNGNIVINWAGRWSETFTHYSYLDLLRSFEAAAHGRPPIVPPEALRGKICLVGLTATGLADVKPNPLEPLYPGLGFQANVINSFLTHRFITPAGQGTNALIVAGISLFCGLFFILLRPMAAFLCALLFGAGWVVLAFTLFCRQGLWLSVVHPVLTIASLFVFSAVYIQMTEEKAHWKFFNLATRDGLTGLYVIRHFRSLSNQMVMEAHRHKGVLSVLMIDIDHFKQVNDRYGHAAGDKVLKEVAAIVQSCLRESDFAGRYGGEELIVLLPKAPGPIAAEVAERIRKQVEQARVTCDQQVVSVTISIGVGVLRPEENVPDPMVHRADEALYRAKHGGRNQVCTEV